MNPVTKKTYFKMSHLKQLQQLVQCS